MTLLEKIFFIFFIITAVCCIGLAVSGVICDNDPLLASGFVGAVVSWLGVISLADV